MGPLARATVRQYIEDMKTIDTDLANELRNFAIEHGEIQFAHLVSQALLGEQWAAERVVRMHGGKP